MPRVYDPPRQFAAMVVAMDALIFDFDGVIANSEPAHERAIRETVELIGLGMSSDLYTQRIIGLDDIAALRIIAAEFERQLSESQIQDLASRKQARFLELVDEGQSCAFDGSVELIREAARRVPIAVCSGAVRIEINKVLSMLGVADEFVCIVTADDVANAKPDPTGYQLTAKKLGADPANCVAIEDTDKGIAAGKAAGLTVVGVCHSLPRERLSEADLIVESTQELSIDLLMQF
jgi:beta-phosphoglucomutase